MVNKIALSIIISIILTIIIVSTVNVGVSLFLNEPDYEDYCNYTKINEVQQIENISKEVCQANNGTWMPQNVQCVKEPCIQGYCDLHSKCGEAFNEAQKPFNQQRFYVFAALGFILLLVGLFTKENLIQITGLATGAILVFQSIVYNIEDKMAVFLTLIGILIIFGVLAYRVITRIEKPKKKSKK